MSNPNGTKVVATSAIIEAIKALDAAIAEWRASTGPIISWRGFDRIAMSGAIEQAAGALFDMVDTLAIDPAARPLVLAIDAFDDAFTQWAEKSISSPDQVDPAGTPEVWHAYQEMLQAQTPRRFHQPDPIPNMLSQKILYRNIAKEYGWFDEAGNPDVNKVQEEITTPGKHYNPKTWKSKKQIQFEQDTEAGWSQREFRLGQKRSYREQTAPHPKERQAAPESIEELIRSGVNAPQIAKMKQVTLADVREVAHTLGLPLAGNGFGAAFLTPDAAQAEQDDIKEKAEAMRIAAINTHGELGDDSAARMQAMAADGVASSDIAKALAAAFPGMTRQQVTHALSRKGSNREKVPA